jgi:hypothetical protein
METTMGYAVHHVDGAEATQLEDLDTLEDALARVEALSNDGAVSQIRVFREIPIQVQTYYRVVAMEGGEEPAAEVVAEAPTPPPPTEPVEDQAVVDPPVEEPVLRAPEVAEADEPAAHRQQAARLQPPPGAMLIAPARTAAEPGEARERAPHRSLFSRG